MSRGIGKTQRAILDALAANTATRPLSGTLYHVDMTVMELAAALGLRDNQVRRAVRALQDRGLVCAFTYNTGGWRGRGEYGPLVPRDTRYWDHEEYVDGYGPEVPTAEVRTLRFDYDLDEDGTRSIDIEYVHMGMPMGASLWVKLNGEVPEYVAQDRALGGRCRS